MERRSCCSFVATTIHTAGIRWRSTCVTIRLNQLKIGVRIRASVREVRKPCECLKPCDSVIRLPGSDQAPEPGLGYVAHLETQNEGMQSG